MFQKGTEEFQNVPKGHQKDPRGDKNDPKGRQREPKGAKENQKETKWEPKGTKGVQKETKGRHKWIKYRCPKKDIKKGGSSIYFLVNFGPNLGPKNIQKPLVLQCFLDFRDFWKN